MKKLTRLLAIEATMSYGIRSRDYVERAEDLLKMNSVPHLFYAAFELRCGVEARMGEDLEAQKHISAKKRRGWQVAKLAKNIEEVFRLGEKEAVARVRHIDTNELIFEARYTPVKKSLRHKAELLGNYLHNAKKFYGEKDDYWVGFRVLLEQTLAELEYANSGRLLGPLLMHPNKKKFDMKMELPTKEEQDFARDHLMKGSILMEIEYE